VPRSSIGPVERDAGLWSLDNGTPEERHARFMARHDARMKKVEEAIALETYIRRVRSRPGWRLWAWLTGRHY
jgi:hypothetical protein